MSRVKSRNQKGGAGEPVVCDFQLDAEAKTALSDYLALGTKTADPAVDGAASQKLIDGWAGFTGKVSENTALPQRYDWAQGALMQGLSGPQAKLFRMNAPSLGELEKALQDHRASKLSGTPTPLPKQEEVFRALAAAQDPMSGNADNVKTEFALLDPGYKDGDTLNPAGFAALKSVNGNVDVPMTHPFKGGYKMVGGAKKKNC